ncbi:MAG: peptidylprolyl isomerase [Candidatus Cloacimonetes bacterium]|nr:peptidylprolyl isomerase [Candidatus Cloacimonadota bacterium]
MKRTLVLGFITIILLSACGREREESIVARVNDDVLMMEEFKALFSGMEWENMSSDEKRERINEWVNITLLAQEADRRKLSQQKKIVMRVEIAEKNVKSNAVLAQEMSFIELSEDDLFNYYKMHKTKFQKQYKQFNVQRIFIREKTKLDSVLTLMNRGLSFNEAAKKYSEEKSSENSGFIGFMGEKNMDRRMWEVLSSLKPWYYKTVELEEGFYIVRHYEERTVYEDKPFTEVKEDIRNIVQEEKRKEIFNNLIYELREKADLLIIF